MSLILLISSLVLFGIAIFILTYNILHTGVGADALSLSNDSDSKEEKKELIQFLKPLIYSISIQYSLKIKNKSYRDNVRKHILTAGLKNLLTVDEFIGFQILCGIFFPFFFVLFNFALQMELSYSVSFWIAGFGFIYPFLYCKQKKELRYNAIVKELPFVTEILALSTEAGLDFIGSIKKIVDKYPDTALSAELQTVLNEIQIGSTREQALKAMAERVDIPELTSFCSVIIDANETGASIAKVLKEQSTQMRLERFVRAEKKGAKASQAILLPMMLFILPAVFIVVFAPVIVQFLSSGS